MKTKDLISDELIQLTNKLGVRIENLEFVEGSEIWYFRMIITPQSSFKSDYVGIEIYQISQFDNETWVSCNISDKNFKELLNG